MQKLRIFGLALAGLAASVNSPAAGQIEGEWSVTLDGQPVENVTFRLDWRSNIPFAYPHFDRSARSRNFVIPKFQISLNTDNGFLVSNPARRLRSQMMVDGYLNGMFAGGYWYIGEGVAQPSWLNTSFSNDCEDDFLYVSGYDPALHRPQRKYGRIGLTFNAAENLFAGRMHNSCWSNQGYSIPIEGRRVGPPATFRLRPVTNEGPAPRLPRLAQSFGEGTGPRRMILHLEGDGKPTVIELSKQYRIYPNASDALAGDRFSIDVLVAQDRRPRTLRLRAIQFTAPPIVDTAARTTILRGRYTGRTFLIGLPFVGVPPSGQSIYDLSYPGAFCTSFAWIPELEFTDNGNVIDVDRPGVSRPRPEAERTARLWPVSSACGARQHPDQVPDWAIRS